MGQQQTSSTMGQQPHSNWYVMRRTMLQQDYREYTRMLIELRKLAEFIEGLRDLTLKDLEEQAEATSTDELQ